MNIHTATKLKIADWKNVQITIIAIVLPIISNFPNSFIISFKPNVFLGGVCGTAQFAASAVSHLRITREISLLKMAASPKYFNRLKG